MKKGQVVIITCLFFLILIAVAIAINNRLSSKPADENTAKNSAVNTALNTTALEQTVDKTSIPTVVPSEINARIDSLLSVIISSPKSSSNPGDYIKAHQNEYNEIILMGEGALPYLINIYWKRDSGLRGSIAKSLFEDLAKKLTGNDYAVLENLDSGHWIKAGRTEAGKPGEPRYYLYKEGKLIRHSKAFVEWYDYILPESNKKLVSMNDLDELSAYTLNLARNEIYARHGYVFKDQKCSIYFKSRPWYEENPGFSDSMLNDTEIRNIELIKQCEDKINASFKKVEGNSESVDLNGDGKQDEIKLECKQGGHTYKLYVNNLVVSGNGDNLDGIMYICDIDSGDKYKEIAITQSGPSADPATCFYYYDGNSIIFMDRTQGSQSDIKMTGSGSFTTKTRGKMLHTWYYTDWYRLSSAHKLENIPQELYRMNCIVTVKKQLTLQKAPADTETAVILNLGDEAVIAACDNKKWCLVETLDGAKGWFAVEGYYKMPGTNLNAADYFDGLWFYD